MLLCIRNGRFDRLRLLDHPRFFVYLSTKRSRITKLFITFLLSRLLIPLTGACVIPERLLAGASDAVRPPREFRYGQTYKFTSGKVLK